jgi:hypothetical protein
VRADSASVLLNEINNLLKVCDGEPMLFQKHPSRIVRVISLEQRWRALNHIYTKHNVSLPALHHLSVAETVHQLKFKVLFPQEERRSMLVKGKWEDTPSLRFLVVSKTFNDLRAIIEFHLLTIQLSSPHHPSTQALCCCPLHLVLATLSLI